MFLYDQVDITNQPVHVSDQHIENSLKYECKHTCNHSKIILQYGANTVEIKTNCTEINSNIIKKSMIISKCARMCQIYLMKMQFFDDDDMHIIAVYASIIVNDGDVIPIIIKKLHFH